MSTRFFFTRILLVGIVMCAAIAQLTAQPTLDFRRIGVQWPQIKLYIQAKCGSTTRFDLDQHNFTLKEDANTINNFSVFAPDFNTHCCMSVALVFDRSSSMGWGSPSGLDGAKLGGNAFVDSLTANCDEATIVSFNQNVTVDVPMTQNKTLLRQGINTMVANGSTAVWDAAIVGIQEVVNKGTKECKAVVLLTDGEDNSSSNSVDDIISFAASTGIRVFTVTLGTGIDNSDCQRIATETGGKYYKVPQPTQLVSVYKEIFRIISRHFEECEITYTSRCPDFSRRNVQLTLSQLSNCPGTDTKTKSFRAPLDTSVHTPILIKLGDQTIYANQEETVPLILDTAIDDIFRATTITITYDPLLISYSGIVIDGFIFKNSDVSVTHSTGSITIRASKDTFITGLGILCGIKFKAKDPPQDASTKIQLLKIPSPVRCTKLNLQDGIVSITSRRPKIESCELYSDDNIIYDKYSSSYYPTPLRFDVNVYNSGDREAKNVRAEILLEPTAFKFASGQTAQKPMTPNTIAPSMSGYATWFLEPLPRSSKAAFPISVTITSDNHTPVVCSKQISIEAIPSMLFATIDPININYDRVKAVYKPMPFELKAKIKNTGYVPTQFTQAQIILPKGLQLDASERGMIKKYLSNITLTHNDVGEVAWFLTHPIALEEKRYEVTVQSWAANADTIEEFIEIVIPPMDGPQIACEPINIPQSVTFDTLIKKYLNEKFTIEYSAINNGGLDADSVRATLVLPPELILDPPTQSTTQYFNPMKIERWKTQIPLNTISWSVRTLPRYTSTVDTVKIKVNGINPLGLPMDEVICTYTIAVDAFGITKLTCTSFGTDSVRFSPLLGFSPNLFLACYSIKNESLLPVTIEKANIIHNIPGITLESLSPKIQDNVIQPGASINICALFRPSPMLVQRFGTIDFDYTTIEPVMETEHCTKSIFIDSSKIGQYPILNLTTLLPDSLMYDCALKQYSQSPFITSASIFNSGNANADSLFMKIELPNVLEFVVPADSLRAVPTVFPQTTNRIEWQVRLNTPPLVDSTYDVRWRLMYRQWASIPLGQDILTDMKQIFVADTICPAVTFSAPMVSFTITKNDSSLYEKEIVIGSRDGTSFNWYASVNSTWISLSTLQGRSGEKLRIILQQKNLAPGKYKTTIQVTVPALGLFAELPVECEIKSIISSFDEIRPVSFVLEQNYPNPFSTSTTINLTPALSLNKERENVGQHRATLKVFDVFGREVLDLSDAIINNWEQRTGNCELKIDNSPSANQLKNPGVYFYRLTVGKESQTKMMMLLK